MWSLNQTAEKNINCIHNYIFLLICTETRKKKVKSLFKHPYVLNEVIIIKSYYYILHTGLNSFQGLVFLIEFSIFLVDT